ncbi:hypothetical protein HYG87_01890 [Methanobacterium alkalithermotolerans]|uniref:CopG family transcriptional regulator n=1 Tax=Methanobacterium alkalithermotolerans TaxID=2731220 RepID=A0A8T8K288_9EURY|nr:hypothetical protein [Methanobacterium alkalithermotolerans]QUH22606.1 hypothetical protein HYG87_01890 [Methanobacterium alkalithermotolerans]
MSTKSVYSIRIPKEYRDMMEEMDDINWQEEIRKLAMDLIQKKCKHKLLKEAKKLRNEMKTIESAKLIREDRSAR